MPTIDDRTSTQSYAKPNVANTLQEDVARLRSALDDIDGDMANALKGGVITDLTDIGAALADGDLFTVYDLSATANRKAAATRITDYTFGKISGDITVTSAGAAAISTGVIVNADVNASAAIAGTKISPDFGSQNVTTTGSSTAAQFVPTSSTVPTNGLYLPAANTVGIATNSAARIQINSTGLIGIATAPIAGVDVAIGSVSSAERVIRLGSLGTTYGELATVGAAGRIELRAGSASASTRIAFQTAAAGSLSERMRLTEDGNLKIGGTANRATTEGTNQLVIFNGTAPVGTLSNGISFYSTAGECRVMDAAGNATLLSPHDSETNEWIYDSSHTPTGRRLRVDMEKLVKFIDQHFGLGFVQETFVTP